MKQVDHTQELSQYGKFNTDDIEFMELDNDSNFLIVLRKNDERAEEEMHIYRSGCAIIFERNFHSMFLVIG